MSCLCVSDVWLGMSNLLFNKLYSGQVAISHILVCVWGWGEGGGRRGDRGRELGG